MLLPGLGCDAAKLFSRNAAPAIRNIGKTKTVNLLLISPLSLGVNSVTGTLAGAPDRSTFPRELSDDE
jgi:hypothetical protein